MSYGSVVTVLALVGLTKKHFGHYAILKILSLRSPSTLGICNAITHLFIKNLGRAPVLKVSQLLVISSTQSFLTVS